MIRSNLLESSENRRVIARKGCFSVVEYDHDLSVVPHRAMESYYAAKMNIRKRQVVAELNNSGVIIQSGEMQLMIGGIQASSNIHGVGDFAKKLIGSKVTGESAVKPRYAGKGQLVLEPTYMHILLEDLRDWNGQMVIEDGMFLACEDTVGLKVVARSTVSSALLGGEGLFNTNLVGSGIVALESPVPAEELIVVDMTDDILKIDGSMAVAWSNTLKFTVERTTKTLVGSAASGEGLVNVYRGTGRVLIAPVDNNPGIAAPSGAKKK